MSINFECLARIPDRNRPSKPNNQLPLRIYQYLLVQQKFSSHTEALKAINGFDDAQLQLFMFNDCNDIQNFTYKQLSEHFQVFRYFFNELHTFHATHPVQQIYQQFVKCTFDDQSKEEIENNPTLKSLYKDYLINQYLSDCPEHFKPTARDMVINYLKTLKSPEFQHPQITALIALIAERAESVFYGCISLEESYKNIVSGSMIFATRKAMLEGEKNPTISSAFDKNDAVSSNGTTSTERIQQPQGDCNTTLS